jgi:MinD-like ATPase involved in chromosome partitioning or flagellar assembly
MSINRDSQDSYDRFFPPVEETDTVAPEPHGYPPADQYLPPAQDAAPAQAQPPVQPFGAFGGGFYQQYIRDRGQYGGEQPAQTPKAVAPPERSYSEPPRQPDVYAQPSQPAQPVAGPRELDPRERPAEPGYELAAHERPAAPTEVLPVAEIKAPENWYSAPAPQTRQRGAAYTGMADWMDEPVDARFIDKRMGDDEGSLVHSADRLDLVGSRKLPPGHGWRKWLYLLTFKQLNLGLSPAEIAYAEMVETIRQPIRGDYKIGVASLKGGVGKTTTTVTLGSVFAQHRKGDRVVALDGNPDFGNLVSRVPRQTNTTVKDLLADEDLSRYGDVRHHTSQNVHGLEVVAGERDLAQSERFSMSEYERVMAVLQRHYSLIFTDCGTGLINEAMDGVLKTANALILVSSVTVDGARAASANIEWLTIHGYQHLVSRAVVILNNNKQGKTTANIEQLKEHFSPHVRAVHVIPFDDHLAEGGEVNLKLLKQSTLRAFEELAELIATDFPSATGKHTREAV